MAVVELWPRWWANAITVLMFLCIAAAVFLIRRASIMRTAPDQAGWRDIRIWAVVLIAVQLGLYVVFS
ncbi:MAG: hypothetical protein ACR2PZ_07325 [Pseudomonadales bacterium]